MTPNLDNLRELIVNAKAGTIAEARLSVAQEKIAEFLLYEEVVEAVARKISEELHDDFDNAFADKGAWVKGSGEKGGRFRDINEPMQQDYLYAARAVLDLIASAGVKG